MYRITGLRSGGISLNNSINAKRIFMGGGAHQNNNAATLICLQISVSQVFN
jgi:hypothetical protein